MQDLIIAFLSSHPSLSVLITVMAVLRTIFKPIMAVLEAGVQASGSEKAKLVLSQVESSAAFKAISFLLDYFTGVKLPVVAASLAGKAP